MSWTGRFVSPHAVTPGATVAVRQPYSSEIQDEAYKKIFPVGVFINMGGIGIVRGLKGEGTITVDVNQSADLKYFLHHPEAGVVPNGFDAIWQTNGVASAHEGTQHILDTIDTDNRAQHISVVAAPFNPWGGQYFDVAVERTDEVCSPIAQNMIDNYYQDNRCLIGYSLRDDVTTANVGNFIAPAIRQMQAHDDHGRFCSAIIQDSGTVTAVGTDLKLRYAYTHPCGYYSNNTPNLEGDLARHVLSGGLKFPVLQTPTVDLTAAEAAVRTVQWRQIQTHKTESGGSSRLRYPYPSELGMIGAMLIGSGAHGLFFFTWTDGANYQGSPEWWGLSRYDDVDAQARMRAASRFARRFNQRIRKPLLSTVPMIPRWTTSGGGASGYPVNTPASAYLSNLYDHVFDKWYVVIVNLSATSANITVSGTTGFTSGALVNMESGVSTNVGSAVTMAGFDWSIWRYDP